MEYWSLENGINTNQEPRTETKEATNLWDFAIQTDREIKDDTRLRTVKEKPSF